MNRGSFFMLPCLLFVILQFVFPAGVPASALACPLGGRDAGPCARRAVSMPVSLCVPLPACRFPGLPVRVPAGMPACRQAYWQCGGQCGVPAGGPAGFPVRKGRGIFPYLYHFGSSWQHLAPMWKSVAFSGGSAALSRTLTLHPRRQTDASGVCRASVFSFGQLRGTGWPVPCPVGDGRLAFQSVADGFLLATANSKVSFE